MNTEIFTDTQPTKQAINVSSVRDAPKWRSSISLTKKLSEDGWRSPDSYSNDYKSLIDGPAVYLFMLYETETYRKAFVAYVGMSANLKIRMQGHNILPMLRQEGYWVKRWFKQVNEVELRKVEADLIASISPPWNVQGRTRGVYLR